MNKYYKFLRVLTENDIILIKKLYLEENLSCPKIAKIIGVSKTTIRLHLKKMGIKLKNISECQQIYKINQNYFDIIDTPEKAYILGFSMADGNVENRTKHRTYSIRIHIKDKEIIEFIRKEIFPNNDKKFIYSKNTAMIGLFIDNKHICEVLTKHGCKPRKTYDMSFPIHIKNSLLSDFIRGYFDGDGCITISKNQTSVQIISHINFNLTLKEILNKLGIKSRFNKHHTTDFTNYLVISETPSLCKFFNFIYNGNFYLKRKYEIFIKFYKKYLTSENNKINSRKNSILKNLNKNILNQLIVN